MTPEEIAELREALAKGTPGPWTSHAYSSGLAIFGSKIVARFSTRQKQPEKDATLIVLMHQRLPDALDAAEEANRLRERVRELEGGLRPFAEYAPLTKGLEDRAPITMGSTYAAKQITAGDARRARTLLEKADG